MQPTRKTKKTSLAGSLLLAHPALKDPNFKRSVVLMSAHNAEGAMGLVLNRPLDKRLGEANGDFTYGPLAGIAMYAGGPVQTDQLLLVAWEEHEEGFRLHFGLDPDKAAELLAGGEAEVRAFLGYSGWSAGQLEQEMKTNTWVVADVPPDLLTAQPGDALWRKVLSGLGGDWQLLAYEPDEPGLN